MNCQKNTARLKKISGIRNEETKPNYADKIISYCLNCEKRTKKRKHKMNSIRK